MVSLSELMGSVLKPPTTVIEVGLEGTKDELLGTSQVDNMACPAGLDGLQLPLHRVSCAPMDSVSVCPKQFEGKAVGVVRSVPLETVPPFELISGRSRLCKPNAASLARMGESSRFVAYGTGEVLRKASNEWKVGKESREGAETLVCGVKGIPKGK